MSGCARSVDGRLVVVGEQFGDEFAPGAHADLGEDRLEVVPHGMGREVVCCRDLDVGQPTRECLSDVLLAGVRP